MWNIVLLIIGGIFGFIVGWLFRDWRFQDSEREALAVGRERLVTAPSEPHAYRPPDAASPESDRLRSELSAKSGELSSAKADHAVIASRLDACTKEREDLRHELEKLRSEMTMPRTAPESVSTLSTPPEPADNPVAPATSSGTGADDLKKIKGVGPVLERLLHEAGVTEFRHIANFTDADKERVAKAMDSFPDRIDREDWIGQARELHFAKYGERI